MMANQIELLLRQAAIKAGRLKVNKEQSKDGA